MRKLPTVLACLTLLALSQAALASPNCTNEPKSKWMPTSAMQDQVKQAGYTVKTFKTTGSCYEIYGKDKNGKRAEVYFNPVTGAVVKKGD
jgi:hypothetical protein